MSADFCCGLKSSGFNCVQDLVFSWWMIGIEMKDDISSSALSVLSFSFLCFLSFHSYFSGLHSILTFLVWEHWYLDRGARLCFFRGFYSDSLPLSLQKCSVSLGRWSVTPCTGLTIGKGRSPIFCTLSEQEVLSCSTFQCAELCSGYKSRLLPHRSLCWCTWCTSVLD